MSTFKKIESMESLYGKYRNDSSEEGAFYKRTGNTLIKVRVFSDNNAGTAYEKIYQIVKNKVETKAGRCGIIDMPQISRPQEGGSDEQL